MRIAPKDDHIVLFGNSSVEKPGADPVFKMVESFGVVLVERHQRPCHALRLKGPQLVGDERLIDVENVTPKDMEGPGPFVVDC